MSPECYASKHYDARANDLWCVGVMMFTCLTGAKPWNSPSLHDDAHRLVMSNGVRSLVRIYNREYLIMDAAVDMLDNIFNPEARRISVDDALNHPFITGLVIDPVYDLDTWDYKSDIEEVLDGELFDLQDQETVSDTSDHGISVTEEQYNDGLSDMWTIDNLCDLSIENLKHEEEVNDRVTAAVSHPVQDSWDLFILRDQEVVLDCEDRIISQSEQTEVDDLRYFTHDLSPNSDIFDELDNDTVTAPVIDPVDGVDLSTLYGEEILFGQLSDLGDKETVADSSDVQNPSLMEEIYELRDISTSDNTLESSSEYNFNVDKVEDMLSAFSGTKRNAFLFYNRSKRNAQV